ncbi:hypothetical protein OSB04_009831 [Centaurea solstitialis]|uniref:Cytochrome P450 n=1 Tax=Centaurea solstitialis TaxID=347529 RepID=A0AA38WBA9_9ASTR|nr:hypothetical protein OSB04_009831 [Centaurea solstitialis]
MKISYLKDNIHLTIYSYWSWWFEASNKQDEISRAILTVSIVVFMFLWYKWSFSSSKTSDQLPLPPGPRGLPILGYLPFLQPDLHKHYTQLAHRYGPIFKIWLGTKLYVIVSSSELAKTVVRDQDQVFANRDPPIAALAITYGGINIVWSNNGPYWRKMRKVLVHEVLSNANLDACRGYRRDEVSKSIKDLYTKIGTKVNINEIAFFTELNVITSMLWGSTYVEGEKTGNLGAEYRVMVFKIIELLGAPNVSDFFPILARFDLQGVDRVMKREWAKIDLILDQIIEERIRSNASRSKEMADKERSKDFLQTLLDLKEQNDAAKSFNFTQMKALLMCILGLNLLSAYQDIAIGGTDTTATMVEWVMAEILDHPEVMKKVQDELSQVVGMDNTLEESHLPKLHYLDAVIKETFRLHPTLPLLTPRCPNQSCTVGGYTVPKGAIVFLNVWAIHRDPEKWENSSEFFPERFLNYNEDNTMWFFPFGSGRRMCPGIPLAEKMLVYMLASLLHAFKWSVPLDEELDLFEKFGIVMKKRKPLILVPSLRYHHDY